MLATNIKILTFLFSFLTLLHPVKAKTLFYQPLLQDEKLTQQDWNEQLSLAQDQGYNNIVIQWFKYGEVDFMQNKAIQKLFASPHVKKFSFWLGLYLPQNYYECFESGKIEEPCSYKHTVEQQIKLAQQLSSRTEFANIKLLGWYIPTELTNKYLKHREVQLMLESLIKWKAGTQENVAISYFYGSKNSLERSKEDISYLVNSGFEVFLQKGNGLINRVEIDDLIDFVPCKVFLVHEVFTETAPNILRSNKEPINHDTCHPLAVFSLRYLAFSNLELTNIQGAN